MKCNDHSNNANEPESEGASGDVVEGSLLHGRHRLIHAKVDQLRKQKVNGMSGTVKVRSILVVPGLSRTSLSAEPPTMV